MKHLLSQKVNVDPERTVDYYESLLQNKPGASIWTLLIVTAQDTCPLKYIPVKCGSVRSPDQEQSRCS